MNRKLEKFFKAEAVVLIGFSPSPKNLCRNIIANLRRWGYQGRIYGISPYEGENDGVRIYTSLEQLPEKPEVGLIFTRAELVPELLLDCARNQIRHIVISSAGFEETGTEKGLELAGQIKAIAEEKGLYIIGPNCIGTSNTQNGLCLSFMPLDPPPAGKIAFLTQSGGVGTSMATLMRVEAFPLGKFVSVGNKSVLDEVDFLEYFMQDPETETICFFLEDLKRAREFFKTAQKSQKPIILFKAGHTPYGAEMARSHTGALAGDELMIKGACQQAGIVWAESLAGLIYLAKAFQMPPMRGNRLLVASPSGGLSVILADLAWRFGFELPCLPKDIAKKYSQQRRAGIIELKNPLDFGDLYRAEVQRNLIRELLLREDFDGAVMAYIYRDPEVLKLYPTLNQLQRDLILELNETIELVKKPVALVLALPYHSKEEVLARSRYPVFDRPEDALFALACMRDFYQKKQN